MSIKATSDLKHLQETESARARWQPHYNRVRRKWQSLGQAAPLCAFRQGWGGFRSSTIALRLSAGWPFLPLSLEKAFR